MEQDYSHLPADVLRIVFSLAFENSNRDPGGKPRPWELPQAARLWFELRLTCKHWEEVLTGTPPLLNVRLAPAPEAALLRWLPSVPVRLLGAPEEGYLDDLSAGEEDEDEEEEEGAGAGQGARILSVRRMLLGMEGAGPAPFWSPAAFQQLEELRILHTRLTEEEPLTFDAAPLQALPRLAALVLGEFSGFKLEGVPATVRQLDLWYDDSSQFVMPQLPQHLRLDRLKVGHSRGVVGLPLGEVWDRCKEVILHAPQVLLGVPCPESLVRQFERPYREGIYVPPHILGDMEALEQSHHAAANCAASDLFEGLSRCRALKVLTLGGGSGGVLRPVPMRAGDRAALPFIFRSQPAGYAMVRDVNYLFSLNTSEAQKQAKEWLEDQEVAWAVGERATRPGFGDTGVPTLECAISNLGILATVRVWREGDPGEAPIHRA